MTCVGVIVGVIVTGVIVWIVFNTKLTFKKDLPKYEPKPPYVCQCCEEFLLSGEPLTRDSVPPSCYEELKARIELKARMK